MRDWFIRVVWVGTNQLRTRIAKDIVNSEKFYVIYLLHIIDIQNKSCDKYYFKKVNNLRQIIQLNIFSLIQNIKLHN